MSKKRDTHKGNPLGHVRKSSRSPCAWAGVFALSSVLASGCARSHSGTAALAEADLPPPAAPAATSPRGSVSEPTSSPMSSSTAAPGTNDAEPSGGSTTPSSPAGRASAEPPGCPKYGAPERIGTIEDAKLNEISGITSSGTPGSFWVHNDSGDGPNVYLVTSEGKRTATFTFALSTVIDVEDMARAPRAGGGSYLYLADIGDNGATRRDGVTILRAREPDEGAPPELPAEIMRVTYPGGPSDAEAFLVDPRTGELVIVTKHPLLPARVLATERFLPRAEMRELGSITPESSGQVIAFVTGAAVSSDGRFVLLRTYEAAYLFTRRAGQSLGRALLGHACRIETAAERQGEAIAFTSTRETGSDTPPPLVTVSEETPTTLWRQTPE